jgi:hypothetical protein
MNDDQTEAGQPALGQSPEAERPPQACVSEATIRDAVMAPWEAAMAEKGICPKCSDSLGRTSEGGGVSFSHCMGCGNIFVLKAESGVQRPYSVRWNAAVSRHPTNAGTTRK